MTSGRTTTTRPSADFDEQLWPVNSAIFLLAAVAVAIIVARGNFDPAQTGLLDNGYLQLGVVGLLIGTLFAAARWLQTRMARRVQLCILFSLLVHLGLAVYLHGHYLAFLAQRERRERQVLAERQQRIIIPDYQSHDPDQLPMPQSFERPVETEVPDQPGLEPVEQPVQQDTPVDRPAPAEPETSEPQQPSPAEIRRVQLAPPRRDEAAAGGQISRQPWEHRPKPDEPVPMPEIRPAGRQTPKTVQPQVARLERQETTSPSRQRQTFEPPASELRPKEALALARQANPSTPTADVPSTPIPMRRLARPSDVPRAEVEPPEPIQAVEPARLADLESQAAAAQRQLDLPARGRSFAEAAPATPRAAPRAAVRRQRPDHVPDLVQTAVPVAVRQPRPRPMMAMAQMAEPAPPAEAAIAGQPDLEAPASRAWQVSRAASLPTGLTAGQGNRPLPRLAERARLGPALGPRAAATSEPSGQPNLMPLGRSRVVRADRVMDQPSGVTTVGDVSASLARGPSGSGVVEVASPAATVERAAPLSVGMPTAAASRGGAEIGWGLGQLAVRMGPPRAPQASIPSLDSTASPQPAARTGARPYLPQAGVETAPLGDTAGMAVEQGGRPGPLEIGPQAAIRPGPATLPTGRITLAATSEATRPGLVAVAATGGRVRFGDEGLSAPGMGRGSAMVRTMGAGPAVLTDGAVAIPEQGPASMAGATGTKGLPGGPQGPHEPAGGVAAPVAGRGLDGLPAAWRSSRQSPLAQSGASRVVGPRLGPSGRADATQVGPLVAVAGPARRAGRLPTAELAGPTGPQIAAPAPGEGPAGQGLVGLEAGPVEPGRRITGLPGSRDWQASPRSLAAAGPMSLTPGTATGPRRLPPGDDQGPALAARVGGGPPRKANTAGLPRGLAETAEELIGTGASAESSGELDVAGGARVGGPSRREGGLPVRIAAALGPGGLSTNPVPVVGIPGHRARPESQVVHSVPQRFLLRKSGGRLAIDGRVRQPSLEAFRQRDPGRRAQMLGQYGPTRGSERAVEMGLEFLATHQFPDGHWSLHQSPLAGQPEYDDFAPAQMRADTAATGLALLSFLGAGYTHMDNKHRAVVRRGIQWLVANQQPDGQLFTIPTDTERAGRIYGHGIGAIALCEAYGMTRDPRLREPAAKAIQFIIDAQHPTQGGWRYTKPDGANTWRKESDTSVSGWQLMALKSAQMAGLEIPVGVMEKVGHWLELAQADEGARYVYNPYASDAPDQRHGRLPNLAMTAEGLLMRMYLGWDRSHPAMIRGADYLKENLPEMGAPELPLRDVYYWYYATQVMFQMQDDHWTAWNDRLRALLVNSQQQDGPLAGSWHPGRPVRDRWAHAGGRLYVTTMNLLMLEVYYRHLPLFRTLVDDAVAGSE